MEKEKLDKQRFLNELFSIHPQGCSAEDGYITVNFYLNEEPSVRANGETLTFDWLVKTYGEYVNWHSRKYHGTDEKYIAKEFKLKHIRAFVREKMYDMDFTKRMEDNRDNYIKGGLTADEINKRHGQYKQEIQRSKTRKPDISI